MNLIEKFNESYNTSRGHDLFLAMYSAFNYGSNSFCHDQAQRLQVGTHDDAAETA